MRFAIYKFLIHLYTFCIASMLPTLIRNRIVYKKYTSQNVCLLRHNCFGFNVMYTFYIQLFRERLSEKVHATIPKGIVGGFKFTVL